MVLDREKERETERDIERETGEALAALHPSLAASLSLAKRRLGDVPDRRPTWLGVGVGNRYLL